MGYKVIDMLGGLPTAEAVGTFAAGYLTKAHDGYLDMYAERIARLFGLSGEEFRKKSEELNFNERAEFFAERYQGAASMEQFMSSLDEWGVERMVVGRSDEGEISGMVGDNDGISQLVSQYPNKLIGFAGENPHKGMAAVRDLERSVKELGLKGLMLRPFAQQMYPNDRRFYPLYTKAAELDIPVWMHTSINFSYTITLDYGRPIYIDHVACDFPELKLIIGHGGWPWVEEAVAICWKHPNVYIDFVSVLPKYLATPDTGWGSLLCYGNSMLQDKVLFSSGWVMLGMPINQIVEEVAKLPLKEETKEKWLYWNAARLLKIDQ